MKLPNFYDFEALNQVKARMGIPKDVYGSLRVEIDPGRLTEGELRSLTDGTGIDVHFDDLTILADGTLAYKDSRVLLHIRDVHPVSNDRTLPKYHVFNCSTLVKMNASGRFDRYVISATVDGTFSIRIITDNKPVPQRTRLDVCKNCLNELSLNGYHAQKMTSKEKDQFVASFVPGNFFAIYPQSLFAKKPIYDSDTAPANVYTDNWPQVSLMARTQAGWRCQECSVYLGAYHLRKYLQTHHKNGQRNDNSKSNLRVLCVACHADQPNHHHIKNTPDYKSFQLIKSSVMT